MSIKDEIIEALQKETPILEAFLTIGLSSEDLTLHLQNNAEISPLVLSKFPPNYKVPEILPMFCFPWGLKLLKGPQETISECFNFIVHEETGTPLYCAAMIIYEAVGNNKSQASIFRTETRDIVNLIKNSKEDYNLLGGNKEFSDRRSRSAFKKSRSRKTKILDVGQDFQYFSTGQVMVPKCLVMVSRYEFLETLKKILMGIYKLTRTKLEIPIECYVCHLFLRVPLPPKGFMKIVYQILTSIIVIKIPPSNQLPLSDCNFTHLFTSLPVSTILSVFLSLLLEENVVFLSSSTDKLCAVSYSLLSLLFPFKWVLSYVPVLPVQLISHLYSPVKYIYGLHSSYKEEVIIRSPANTCIVDLDEGIIEDHNEIVNIREKTEKSEPVCLPEHYSKKLAKQLMEITEDLRSKQIKRLSMSKCEEIRNAFFQFFVSLLVDYKEFLVFDKADPSDYTTYFNSAAFISKQKTDKDFFRRFFNTQIFSNFCERNFKPANIDQQSENLFFSEHTVSKKNRGSFSLHKKETLFLSDTSHSIREKLQIPLPENHYTKKSYFFYYTFPELDYEILSDFGLPKKIMNKVPNSNFPRSEISENCSPLNFNYNHETLFVAWLKLWISYLWLKEEIERNERVSELVSVLEKMMKSKQNPDFFRYSQIIERCLEVDPYIALSVFAFMDDKRVLINNQLSILLNKVLYKLFSRDRFVVMHSLSSNPQDEELSLGFFNQKTHKRTFSKSFQKSSQNVNINLVETCEICGKFSLIFDETLKHFCCKAIMVNTLKVFISVEECETVPYLSVPRLLNSFMKFVEEKEKINGLRFEDLRARSEIFWNLIWHFNCAGLGFKFFVPYERESQEREMKVFVADSEGMKNEISFAQCSEKSCQTDEEIKKIFKVLE